MTKDFDEHLYKRILPKEMAQIELRALEEFDEFLEEMELCEDTTESARLQLQERRKNTRAVIEKMKQEME